MRLHLSSAEQSLSIINKLPVCTLDASRFLTGTVAWMLSMFVPKSDLKIGLILYYSVQTQGDDFSFCLSREFGKKTSRETDGVEGKLGEHQPHALTHGAPRSLH